MFGRLIGTIVVSMLIMLIGIAVLGIIWFGASILIWEIAFYTGLSKLAVAIIALAVSVFIGIVAFFIGENK